MVLLAWLSALKAPDTTVVSVAFDLDGRRGQPARGWPHASGLRAAGADVVVTAWGTGADFVDLRTGRRTRLGEVAVDTRANAIEVAVPVGLLPGNAWRMWAATGLWDPAAGTFMAVGSGAPTATRPGNGGNGAVGQVFNVAFRDHERGTYYEQRQGDAGSVPVTSPRCRGASTSIGSRGERRTPCRSHVGVGSKRSSWTRVPPSVRAKGRPHTGVAGRQGGFGPLEESTTFQFYGRWQPYSLYVPRSYDGSTPIPSALVLHGRGGSHGSYNRQPGFLRDMGEHPGLPPLALITPLARGESFYTDYGERSTLLALDDAARRLRLDPDRQYLTGYSMGGYGVFRLAVRYPDRWAAAVSWAGFTGEFLGTAEVSETLDYNRLTGDPGGLRQEIFDPLMAATLNRRPGPIEYQAVSGDPVQALESLVNLPVLQLGGTNDEIVPVTGQLAAASRLEELGYRHRFDLYPGYEHITFALVDDWTVAREYLGDRRRVTRPRHVVFATSPAWIDPRVADEIPLPAPAAWWVTGLQVRGGADDVRSFGWRRRHQFGVARASTRAPGPHRGSGPADPQPAVRYRLDRWRARAPGEPARSVREQPHRARDRPARGRPGPAVSHGRRHQRRTRDDPLPRLEVGSAVVTAAGRRTFTTRCPAGAVR